MAGDHSVAAAATCAGCPQFPPSCRSLLSQALTPEVYARLWPLKTALGVTIDDCIACGVACLTHPVGVWAGDAESYVIFSPLLSPILSALHPLHGAESSIGENLEGKRWSHPLDVDINSLPLHLDDPDPWKSHVTGVRISVARNIAGMRLSPSMTLGDRQRVFSSVLEACGYSIAGQSGRCRTLSEVLGNSALLSELEARGLMMDGAPAATTSCAGLSDHWPAGRGLWHADDFSLVVWICGEEHVRIVGTAGVGTMEGMDAVDACSMAFGTVRDALAQISETLPFELNQELGYVTANLATIGTGMRVSIGVKGLDHICPRVADVCDELWMEAQPVKQVQGSFIVSSSITLGISSKDVLRDTMDCVAHLVRMERKLSKHKQKRGGC